MSLRDYGLAELDLEKAIRIDPDVDYMLGDDQAFYCYPVRFPTVEFELIDTTALCVAVDIIRKGMGFPPMLEDGGDTEGWYRFYLGLNGYTESHVDASIMAVVENSDSDDNDECYEIALAEDEQRIIYDLLDRQCRLYYGKSCADLLEEARYAMEADV